jgi:hypothetical protein
MQTNTTIEQAYHRTALAHLGISLDTAINTPMYAMCLSRIAEAISKPYVPLPKHAASKPLAYKD